MKKEEQKCRVCGCTQMNACPGGCYWVEEDLCSRCAVCEICGNTGEDYDIYTCDICGKKACLDCGEDFDQGFACKECLAKQTKCDCNKCRNRETFDCDYQYCYDCPDFYFTDINNYIQEVHQNAKNHGWWDDKRAMAELLCLIHSEVSEALEEDRNHHGPTETYYSGKKIIDGKTIIEYDHYPHDEITKPEGIPSELADIVIRVMDICGHYGIDLEAAIKEKMKYNKKRPFKHGGKKI